jgi:2-oxo-4-hydroxy-4-carboxy-5-ureidoimidazoline decarboxylase
MLTLDHLNTTEDFTTALDGIFEHAPWVAERTVARRPFPTVAALHAALMQTVTESPELVAFLNAHPELAADKLPTGLTAESASEQSGLAMTHAEGAADLPALNRAYRDRFGFPFIIAVARHTPENVIRSLRHRLTNDPAAERAAAIAEIGHITKLRLAARVTGPGAPSTSGHLSTHVLDVSCGGPAAGLAVTLRQEGRVIAETITDSDGRTGAHLLPPGPLRQGRYELRFDTSAYFAAKNADTLYETIPIPFRITESEARYHIPLLLAPFAYSTYRGS